MTIDGHQILKSQWFKDGSYRWAKYMGKIDTMENIAIADPKNMYLDICIDPR